MKFKILIDKRGHFDIREYKENFKIICPNCNSEDTYDVNEDKDLFCGGCGSVLVVKGRGRTCFDLADITKLKNIIKMSKSHEDRRNAVVLLGRALEWCQDISLCEFLLNLSLNDPDRWIRKKAESILSQQRESGSARLKQEINLLRKMPAAPSPLISRQREEVKSPPPVIAKEETDKTKPTLKKEKSLYDMQKEFEKNISYEEEEKSLYDMHKEVENIGEPVKREKSLYELQEEFDRDTSYEEEEKSLYDMHKEVENIGVPVKREKSLYELQEEFDRDISYEEEEKSLYDMEKEFTSLPPPHIKIKSSHQEEEPIKEKLPPPHLKGKKDKTLYEAEKKEEADRALKKEKSLYDLQKEFEEGFYDSEESREQQPEKKKEPARKKKMAFTDILLEVIDETDDTEKKDFTVPAVFESDTFEDSDTFEEIVPKKEEEMPEDTEKIDEASILELIDSAVDSIESTRKTIKKTSTAYSNLSKEEEISMEEDTLKEGVSIEEDTLKEGVSIEEDSPEKEALSVEKTEHTEEENHKKKPSAPKPAINEIYFPIFPSKADLIEEEEEEEELAKIKKEINIIEEEIEEPAGEESSASPVYLPPPPSDTFTPIEEAEEEDAFRDLLGGVTTESLIEHFLIEEEPQAKYDIIFVMGEMKNKDATEFLSELLLKASDKEIRMKSVEALEKIKDKKCLSALGKSIKKEKSKKIRKKSAQLYSLLKHNINRSALLSQG